MKRAFQILLIVLLPCSRGFAQSCNGVEIDTDEASIQILSALSPTAAEPVSRKCITVAIQVSSELRSSKTVPPVDSLPLLSEGQVLGRRHNRPSPPTY